MHEGGAFEAKNKLGQLLDHVEHGEEIVITRRGRGRLPSWSPRYQASIGTRRAARLPVSWT